MLVKHEDRNNNIDIFIISPARNRGTPQRFKPAAAILQPCNVANVSVIVRLRNTIDKRGNGEVEPAMECHLPGSCVRYC